MPTGSGELLETHGAGGTPAAGEPVWLDPSSSVLSSRGATASGVPEQGTPSGGGNGTGIRVCWSGSMAELDGGGLFAEDPRTWGSKGWSALEAAVSGRTLCLRPHARHVVSDVPGCRKVLAAEWAGGVGLLVDPMSMMTSAMLNAREAEDHLCRVLEMVGEVEASQAGRILGVVVSGGVVDERCGVAVVPLRAGVLDGGRVVERARRILPAWAGWVVLAEDAGIAGGA